MSQFIWYSGRLVPWDDAQVHVTAVGWPSLSAVFEGIRAYKGESKRAVYVFRLDEHLKRLERSMRFMRTVSKWSREELAAATVETLRANKVTEDAYIQPMAFSFEGARGTMAMEERPGEIYIRTQDAPSKLASDEVESACVSSWTRIHDAVLPPRVKAVCNYQNSRLGSSEAKRGGYDTAIFLNEAGKVAEGGGSCLFLIRDGKVITPPLSAGILESITRVSLLELAEKELHLSIEERTVDRSELYFADEMFFCGTMHEIGPVGSVDGYTIGSGGVGPITRKLRSTFEKVVRGADSRYADWLTEVTL